MSELAVTLTITELRDLVREAVRTELSKRLDSALLEAFTLEQIADVLHLSTKSVLALVRREGFPGAKVGGLWRFEREAVREWLRAKAVQPGAHSRKHAEHLRALDGGRV